MKKNCYFSYSYTTSNSLADTIKTQLRNLGLNVGFYRKGSPYSDEPIRKCDIFVVHLPEVIENINKISAGVQKELKLANQLKKDIIIAMEDRNKISFHIGEVNNNMLSILLNTEDLALKCLKEQVEKNDLDWMKTTDLNKIIL